MASQNWPVPEVARKAGAYVGWLFSLATLGGCVVWAAAESGPTAAVLGVLWLLVLLLPLFVRPFHR